MNAESLRSRVEDVLRPCAGCGTCQSICPVYAAHPWEGGSARGKLHALRAFVHGNIHDEVALARLMDECMLCGRCTDQCPNGVEAKALFREARAFFAQRGHAGKIAELALERLLPSSGLFRSFMAAGFAGKPVLDALLRQFSGLALRFPALTGVERMPKLVARSFVERMPTELAGPKGAPRIAIFAGCVTSWLRPSLGETLVHALQRHYTVIIPKTQGCCGIPALSGGFPHAAKVLMLRNLAALLACKADVVLTPCASCTHMLANEMQALLGEEFDNEANDIAAKVMDVTRFMAENRPVFPAAPSSIKKLFIHTPCHLRKDVAGANMPAALAETMGLEYAHHAPGQCCGGGALVPMLQPVVSANICAAPLRDFATFKKDSADCALVTSCNGCFVQWTRLLPAGTPILHPLEVCCSNRIKTCL